MIQFANKETLLCSSHCLSFYQVKEKLFFQSKEIFQKRGICGHWCATQHEGWYARGDRLLWVYWRIFLKIFVSATDFCRGHMLQKIKSDRICATCYGNKILLWRQRFSQKFSGTHEVICHCDVSLHYFSHPTLYTQSDLSP